MGRGKGIVVVELWLGILNWHPAPIIFSISSQLIDRNAFQKTGPSNYVTLIFISVIIVYALFLTDTSASFDLIFKDRNTSNYVELETSFPNLSSFTVCLWFKSMERQLLFLSYATEPFTDAIMMFLSSTGLFRFLVMNEQTWVHFDVIELARHDKF